MKQAIQYSPFNVYHQQNTVQKQTTQHKHYPINKYQFSKNESEVKQRLFSNNYNKQKQVQKIDFYGSNHQKEEKMFQGNDRVKQILQKNHLKALNSISYDDLKSMKPCNISCDNTINNKSRQFKQIQSKNKKNKSRKRIQSNKSCFAKIKNKKSLGNNLYHQFQQTQEQLDMYKQLCITLRKQNQDLQSKIMKQNKKSARFYYQIDELKNRIRKMYDHCIQKNKSRKNVDTKLNLLIEQNKQNKNNRYQNKENAGSFNNGHLCAKRSNKKNQSLQTNSSNVYNKKTIDPSKNSRKKIQCEDSYLKEKVSKQNINEFKLKKQSEKAISKKSMDKPQQIKICQYDISDSSDSQKQVRTKKQISLDSKQQKNEYKQFFEMFVRSLQIFQGDQNEKRQKRKLLQDKVFHIQWAKQQWLQIVEHLIKEGYVSDKITKKQIKSTHLPYKEQHQQSNNSNLNYYKKSLNLR